MFFSRTTESNSTKLGTKKGTKAFANRGPLIFKKDIMIIFLLINVML